MKRLNLRRFTKSLLILLIGFSGCAEIPTYGDFTGNNNMASFTPTEPFFNVADDPEVPVFFLNLTNFTSLSDFSFDTETVVEGTVSKTYVKCYYIKFGGKDSLMISATYIGAVDSPVSAIKLGNLSFAITKQSIKYTDVDTDAGVKSGDATVSSITPKSNYTYLYGSLCFQKTIYSSTALAKGETGYFIISELESTLITELDRSKDAPLVDVTDIPKKVDIEPSFIVENIYESVGVILTATLSSISDELFQPTSNAIAQSVSKDASGLTFTVLNSADGSHDYDYCQLESQGTLFILFETVDGLLIPKMAGKFPFDSAHYLDSDTLGLIKPTQSISLFAELTSFNANVDTVTLITSFTGIKKPEEEVVE